MSETPLEQGPSRYSFVAVCAPGLGSVLEQELVELSLIAPGPSAASRRRHGEARDIARLSLIPFEGSLLDGARACLFLRSASTVRLVLTREAGVKGEGALRRVLQKLDLEPYLSAEEREGSVPIALQVASERSAFRHTGRLYQVVEKALSGRNFTAGTEGLLLRVERDCAELSLDLAGTRLHQRGWRREGGRAPMRETLASGLLSLAGWTPAEALLDPMAGSGTLAIEAALQAAQVAPGAHREFAFETLPAFAEILDTFTKMREEARRGVNSDSPLQIFASDSHRGAVASIRRNASRALIEKRIKIGHYELPALEGEFLDGRSSGLVICNAPYGKRVGGDHGSLIQSYRGLGEAMRSVLKGWRLALVTSEAALAKETGLALKTAAVLQNGGIRVNLYLSAE